MLSLLINFPEQLNDASTLNIREVIKFYNLGNKSYEIDFRLAMSSVSVY